jgi:HrpA-like RNA helicase
MIELSSSVTLTIIFLLGRIAAITVAERVAFERQEQVGHTVGYQVRLNSRCCPSTRILYCTTGIS